MIYLNHLGIVCALGSGNDQVAHAMFEAESGIQPTEAYSPGRTLPLGCVSSAIPPSIEHFPVPLQSRNNALALAALSHIKNDIEVVKERFGSDRIGVVIGTSTSGIYQSELAIAQHVSTGAWPSNFHFSQQELASPANFIAQAMGLQGPTYVHSSACASSAKAMASAARLLRMGVCDAVISGGVDSLCQMTVAGFGALDSVSGARCNPLSVNRDGINIGEGAAFFVMTREPADISLRGYGETSDAYHLSAPDPQGGGAMLAIQNAMQRADVRADEIDYVNLHGTATLQNDAMEAAVVHRLLGEHAFVSSTKSLTGHTLGAAGAIEAALCWLAMHDDRNRLPPHLWDGVADPALPTLRLATTSTTRKLRRVLSHSFAFGGANAVLLFGRE